MRVIVWSQEEYREGFEWSCGVARLRGKSRSPTLIEWDAMRRRKSEHGTLDRNEPDERGRGDTKVMGSSQRWQGEGDPRSPE